MQLRLTTEHDLCISLQMHHMEGRLAPCQLQHLISFADSGHLLGLLNQSLTQGVFSLPLPIDPSVSSLVCQPTPLEEATSAPGTEAAYKETALPEGASTPKMPSLYPGRLTSHPLELPETPAPKRRESMAAEAVALDTVRKELRTQVERFVRNKLVGMLLNTELDAWLERKERERQESLSNAACAHPATHEATPGWGLKTEGQARGVGYKIQTEREADVSTGGVDSADDMEVVVQDSDGEAIEMTDDERAGVGAAVVDVFFPHGMNTGLKGELPVRLMEVSQVNALGGRLLAMRSGAEKQSKSGDNRVTTSEEERGQRALEKHREEQRKKEEEKRKWEAESALQQEEKRASASDEEQAEEVRRRQRRQGTAVEEVRGESKGVKGEGAAESSMLTERGLQEAGGVQSSGLPAGEREAETGERASEEIGDQNEETSSRGQGSSKEGKTEKGKKRGAKTRKVAAIYGSEGEGGGKEDGGGSEESIGEGGHGRAGPGKMKGKKKRGGGKTKKGRPLTDEERQKRNAQLADARAKKALMKEAAKLKRTEEPLGKRQREDGPLDGSSDLPGEDGDAPKRQRGEADSSEAHPSASPEPLAVRPATEEQSRKGEPVFEDVALASPSPESPEQSAPARGKKGPGKGLRNADQLLREAGMTEAPRIPGLGNRGSKNGKMEGKPLGGKRKFEACTGLGVSQQAMTNGTGEFGGQGGKGVKEESEADSEEGKPRSKKGKKGSLPFTTPVSKIKVEKQAEPGLENGDTPGKCIVQSRFVWFDLPTCNQQRLQQH
jgi:hypothetical protein